MRGPHTALSPPMDFSIGTICISFENIQSLLHADITILKSKAEPITTLIDSTATSPCISLFHVEYLQLRKKKLKIPQKIKMLDGSNPQALVTHYTKIPFVCNGRKSTQHFLISPISCHKIILGTPWPKEEDPLIH